MSSGPTVTIKFDDAEFLSRPHRWPHGNWCPVIRSDDTDGFNRGIVFADEPLVILKLCRHNGWGVHDYFQAVRKTYLAVEEMVADGWRVD